MYKEEQKREHGAPTDNESTGQPKEIILGSSGIEPPQHSVSYF